MLEFITFFRLGAQAALPASKIFCVVGLAGKAACAPKYLHAIVANNQA